MPVHHFEVMVSSQHANAGYARRLAMQLAEDFVTPHGVLLTTDADACVYPNWMSANLFALRQGADAVAGCVEIDPAEAVLIPPRLHENDARECAYAVLLDAISARLDWDPADPWPRHCEHSGASIAVTLDILRNRIDSGQRKRSKARKNVRGAAHDCPLWSQLPFSINQPAASVNASSGAG
jgi:hypothetical protein